ncbi:MAG: hypothetical protein J5I41_10450 [Saprospiraceae bacterium]|nr:hypothetical protein [Saprospiraceae bacterium]
MRYCFIDRINKIDWGRSIEVTRATTMAEPFYAQHFEGFPVLPGALQIEAMAQACGALIEICSEYKTFSLLLQVEKTQFRQLVHPGDVLSISASLESDHEESALFSCQIHVGENLVSRGQLITGKVHDRDREGAFRATMAGLEDFYRFPLRNTVITGKPVAP